MTVTVTHWRDVSASVEAHLAIYDSDGHRSIVWWARCFACDAEEAFDDEAAAVAWGEDHSHITHRWEDDS